MKEDTAQSKTANPNTHFNGKGKVIAAVFSHRVKGTQNDPKRIIDMLRAAEASNFEKIVFVTTDLLNVHTLVKPVKSDAVPDPEAYVRVQAFQYLVNFLKDNAELFLSLKIDFDFLPFYQVRYNDERLKAPLRDLFFVKNATQLYSHEVVMGNISQWVAETEANLRAHDLTPRAEYDKYFQQNKEMYEDGENAYKSEVDKLAKTHMKDEPSWSQAQNSEASRMYQFGEGALNKHLAKRNKVSPARRVYDCLLYTGGEISTSLKFIEKNEVARRHRLEQVVYSEVSSVIVPVGFSASTGTKQKKPATTHGQGLWDSSIDSEELQMAMRTTLEVVQEVVKDRTFEVSYRDPRGATVAVKVFSDPATTLRK